MASEVSIAGADLPRRVADLERELNEAHQREAATAEVLKVISGSRFDLQSVFDMLVRSALKLCEAERAFIFRFDGQVLRAVASQNVSSEMMEFVRRNPVAPGSHSASARAAHEQRTIHIEDIRAEPGYTYGVMHVDPIRTVLAIPLLKAHELLGVIVVYRHEVRQFTVRQIALLETFADQAVIAIENLRLFEEMQARTRDLTESREYQTATSEVLSTVARSPSEPQRVLDLIIETAMRLCQAESGNIWKIDDSEAHAIAAHGFDAGFVTYQRSHTIRPGRGNLIGRIMIERRIMHIEDVLADPEYTDAERQKVGCFRSVLGVPMLRDDKLIGVIALAQSSVRPFSDRQIALVTTFADQAVIAIENTRLFEEAQARNRDLSVALEQQTATSEVLSVISRSKFDVQPVLDTIARGAARLCGGVMGGVFRYDGTHMHVGAMINFAPGGEEIWRRFYPRPATTDTATGRAILEKSVVIVADVRTDTRAAWAREVARTGGYRSAMAVPMLREGVPIGAIIVVRVEPGYFPEAHVDLLKTFADQAVIAIENTRLFEEVQARTRELTESLEQQTATGEILASISASMTDPQPVFDAIVRNVNRLLSTQFANVQLLRDGIVHMPASGGESRAEELVRYYPRPVDHTTVGGQAMLTNEVAQYSLGDVSVAPSATLDFARGFGISVLLAAPMIHNGKVIGAIGAARHEAKPFDDKEIALIKAFADQAVIAIENARLFEEVQARTRELAKTVDDLEIASQHKSQFVANMSHELRTPLAAILGYAELIQEGFYGSLPEKSMDALTRIRSNGKHLLGLINTVLDIAKIESGQFTLNMAEYAIESVVETVRSATESLAQNKKLALRTEAAKPLPVGVGDEQRLTQVLLNLVGNAIKFTDTGEVCVTAKSSDGHFCISVSDTGPGIPAEYQTRIFEQFQQVDNSNTRAKGGTGLGLAIAKQIVEMHGGRIWVESTLGKGSKFQMEIPTRAEFQTTSLEQAQSC